MHSKKIGTFFTAGLTHFFLVLFINIKALCIAPTVGACNTFVSIVEQKSLDLAFKRIFTGIAQLVEKAVNL
ncbi:MAG TPA: hypothetical protein VGZ24_11095 [Chthoniobacterales bacterium]|nr:hypothetical protein [Chthoniobacterales bacterium]